MMTILGVLVIFFLGYFLGYWFFPNDTHHYKSFNSNELLSKSELHASKIQIEEANTQV
ncbi:hypothetical protein SVI_2506 [Shewanella violacea DSS12]|uniref:Uncharacterized protein n=1 Tax=Shewanella violacea (strain JCM 10179 / CIP 106290 / LMG 19151 / DSS12) TaxID=637905 RepID=D4ZLC8_SHEVD|nr:hypothetical protein SVI_2506 [Shewanella violacea DSS12]